MFSSVIVHLGGFLDSSDLSDLSHFSAGFFPKVFLKFMNIHIFCCTILIEHCMCSMGILIYRLSVKTAPSSEPYF